MSISSIIILSTLATNPVPQEYTKESINNINLKNSSLSIFLQTPLDKRMKLTYSQMSRLYTSYVLYKTDENRKEFIISNFKPSNIADGYKVCMTHNNLEMPLPINRYVKKYIFYMNQARKNFCNIMIDAMELEPSLLQYTSKNLNTSK